AAGRDADRSVEVQEPASQVEGVDAVVAQLAGAIVPVPVPLVVETILIEWPLGSGAEPEIIVHALGNLFVLPAAYAGTIAGDPGAGERNLAELAGADELDRAGERSAAATLRAHLDDALVPPRRLDHAPAFDQVVRDRLLDIDVLAGLTGPDCSQGVPVVGR